MRRHYALTFFTVALVTVAYLVAFRIVTVRLGPAGFGEYALARRMLSTLAPVGVLGADYALARLVAHAVSDRGHRLAYPAAGLLLTAAGVAATSLVLIVFREFFARLFFGSPDGQSLVTAIPVLLAGAGLYGIAYGNLRGSLRMGRANLLTGLVQGAAPLLAVGIGRDVPAILTYTGLLWVALSLAFLVFQPMSVTGIWPRAREVATYGIPRVPGDLIQLALFAAPGVIVLHLSGIRFAGVVAFGVAALAMVGSAISPIAYVLLPLASTMIASGSAAELRRHAFQVAWLVAAVLLFATLVLELSADIVVRLYMGQEFGDTANVLRIAIAGAVPWGLYVTLKSVVDASHVRAINTRNMVVAGLVFAALVGIALVSAPPASTVMAAFVAALYVLGALTVVEAYRSTRAPLNATVKAEPEDVSFSVSGPG